MEKDFTIFVRAKIVRTELKKCNDSFIFARNGQHCGIFVYVDEHNTLAVRFRYWFKDEEKNSIFKDIEIILPEENLDTFNDYVAMGNDEKKIMSFHVNGKKVGEINYEGLEKFNYTSSFIWLGCGTMMMIEPAYKNIGSFEYELLYCLDKQLTIKEINDINNNYKTKYLNYNSEYELPILNDEIPNKERFKIFSDFDVRNTYKIWNMIDNSNYFQLYIENNIYF
jgi:uncharacterized protein YkuJ